MLMIWNQKGALVCAYNILEPNCFSQSTWRSSDAMKKHQLFDGISVKNSVHTPAPFCFWTLNVHSPNIIVKITSI